MFKARARQDLYKDENLKWMPRRRKHLVEGFQANKPITVSALLCLQHAQTYSGGNNTQMIQRYGLRGIVISLAR